MTGDTQAKRRAAIAIKARLKDEAAQADPPARKAARPRPACPPVQQKDGAAPRQDRAQRTAPAAPAVDARQVDQQRADQARQETARKVEAAAKRARQQTEQRKAAETKRTFNRQAEDRKATERKIAARKAEQQRQADEQQQARAAESRVKAQLAADERRQRADQEAEQRRQIAAMRNRHRSETRSHQTNIDTAEVRHWEAVRAIDNREQERLRSFDIERRSLKGRAVEVIKGKAEIERQRADLVKSFESERLTRHRDFEAQKERQFTAAQDTRIRHGIERRAMIEGMRADRLDLQQTQEALRPQRIAERVSAIEQGNQARAQDHTQERAQPIDRDHTRGLDLSEAFSRGAAL